MTDELSKLEQEIHEYSHKKLFPLKDKVASAIGQQVLIVNTEPIQHHLFTEDREDRVLGILTGQLTPKKEKGRYGEELFISVPFEKHAIHRRRDWEAKEGPYNIEAYQFSKLDTPHEHHEAEGCFGSKRVSHSTMRIIVGDEAVNLYFRTDNMAIHYMKTFMEEKDWEMPKKYASRPNIEYARALLTIGVDAPKDCKNALLNHLDDELRKIIRLRAAEKIGTKTDERIYPDHVRRVLSEINKYDQRDNLNDDILGFRISRKEVLAQLSEIYKEEQKEGSD